MTNDSARDIDLTTSSPTASRKRRVETQKTIYENKTIENKTAARSSRAASGSASFKKLFADARRHQRERIRKAGKHECIKTLAGTVSRVTGRGDKILKRPVVGIRFYECKICGRDMTPNEV